MRAMRRWRRGVGVLAAAILAFAVQEQAARAAPAEKAVDAIHKANDRLKALLSQKAPDQASRDRISRQITRELRGLFDIAFLAERAMVDHWARMTPKQRADLQATLQKIIERNYLSQLRGNLDYQTDYLGEIPQDGDVLVRTVIRAEKDGRPSKISVDYRLRPEGNLWRVYDVITEGVSVLQNYRAQFNRIVAKDGVDGLLARMHARLRRGEPGQRALPD